MPMAFIFITFSSELGDKNILQSGLIMIYILSVSDLKAIEKENPKQHNFNFISVYSEDNHTSVKLLPDNIYACSKLYILQYFLAKKIEMILGNCTFVTVIILSCLQLLDISKDSCLPIVFIYKEV